MNMKVAVVAVVILLMSACTTGPVSMNMQRSIARASGDMATIMVLDAQYDKITPEKVINVATKIKTALEATTVDGVDTDALLEIIKSNIDIDALNGWATTMVSKIPAGMSVKDGKVIIIDMCEQIILAANKFDPTAAPKKEETE